MATIQVAILHTGYIRHDLSSALQRMARNTHGHKVLLTHSMAQPVANNRNRIVKSFLRSDADFLLMLDSDVVPRTNLLDVVEHNLDIVGFPCPVWKGLDVPGGPVVMNITLRGAEQQRLGSALPVRSSLVEVAEMGTGAMLIARRVLEHEAMRAPFLDSFDRDGVRTCGEDLGFCRRARARGFKVWTATQHVCSHYSEIDLLDVFRTVQRLSSQKQRVSFSPTEALRDKRLIFCVSPGRCGTRYLAYMLDTIPGIVAVHEPQPRFSRALRMAQSDPGAAYQFWLNEKLPIIAQADGDIYVETSHCFNKGFVEPLLNLGILPDVIILRRPHREVALSMWRRGAIPGRNRLGRQFHVQPNDPGVLLPLDNWEKLDDYTLCYWYCLEMEQRAVRYTEEFKRRGATVVRTTLSEITTEPGFRRLVTELDLPEPDWSLYALRWDQKINANDAAWIARQPRENLAELEAEVMHG